MKHKMTYVGRFLSLTVALLVATVALAQDYTARRFTAIPPVNGILAQNGMVVAQESRAARIGVEKHRRRRGGWRRLAVVDHDILIVLREMDHHEAAAAEVSGAWIGDGKREADRDRGVDRIAAAVEHLDADAGSAAFLRHHHAVVRGDRLRWRDDAARGLELRRRLAADQSGRCDERDSGKKFLDERSNHNELFVD